MARLSVSSGTNRFARSSSSLQAVRVLSPQRPPPTETHMPTKRCTSNTISPLLAQLLTVTGLIFIFVTLFFDYSVASQVASHLSTPLRIFSALHFNNPNMPSTHKSTKPPSKKQLGHAGWTLIHSIAANYPQAPSANDQYHAKAFLRSIGKLYPCKRCRQHFEKHLAASPPDLSSRDKFMLWTCGAHNAVNRRQGKPEFPCRMSQLEKRWGDCGCQLKSGAKK